ncbi:MAG: hypothetical protein R2751_16055 [Bacteroidales bacterium]
MLLGLGFSLDSFAQTVVFDQEIYWQHPPNSTYGGYGFYWWHWTDGGPGIENYGDMSPTDWTTPLNYYNGEFQLRFEVLEMPSNETFYIQFGIWSDYSKGTSHPETVSGRKLVTPGSVYSGSLGSPNTWWQKQPADPVDFSRPEDFYRIGIVLWNNSPTCIPMGTEWNADGCPEYAYKYFPMRARVTVTATSGGSGPVIYPPSYSVDYTNERTNKVVSTDDQYSYSSSFSPVYDGNGQYLTLTPGTDVYFRKKADYSKTQHLDVPSRPATPSFGINYGSEQTSTTVSSTYEHANSSDMSGAVTGTGAAVTLTPGSNKYFRARATSSSFRSGIQTLTVPSRPSAPAFGIDYTNERTSTSVSSSYSYSTSSSMSGAVSGTGSPVTLTPGQAMYFRLNATASAFASAIQTLSVPARPAAPTVTIDFANQRTSTTIGSTMEYATVSTMSGAVTGTGGYVSVLPESDLYLRSKSTASAFASSILHLDAPARPAAPAFVIDYASETTSTAVTTGEYATIADMSGALTERVSPWH